jgi:predicted secreted protein
MMGYFNGSVLFVLIWWTVLFAVLPLGTQPIAEPDQTTGWRGAPAKPQIARKLIITTVVTGLIWLLCAGIIASGWISFRHGYFALPEY